ncbi:TPR repeat-containing thioredoxin TTL1-like [Oryza brachyantha]|nr:TPR repeat-containing thioredoxin TTL1-like [Oryza brachyantha]
MAHRAPMPGSLSDALAAAVLRDKPDALPPGRLSPVSPLLHSRVPTPTSSSSGSSGSAPRTAAAGTGVSVASAGVAARRGDCYGGEGFGGCEEAGGGYRCSGAAGPLIYTSCSTAGGGGGGGAAGSSTATSALANGAFPAGNIYPSGRLPTTPPVPLPRAARRDVLGSGTGNYGHGSVVRARCATPAGAAAVSDDHASPVRTSAASTEAEEIRRAGNEQYKNGCFEEALRLYDRALAICPDSAACRGNRAAALIGLNRLSEAVRECEEAIRLDPSYGRAHHRLASLQIRFGRTADARKQMGMGGLQPDVVELHKLEAVEKHLGRFVDARKIGNWKSALRECNAAIAAGADFCAMLFASRAEALLQMNQLDEADLAISRASKLDCSSSCTQDMMFCGFQANSYLYYVHAQVDIAFGRFDGALSSVEKARKIDSGNIEVMAMHKNVKTVAQARSLGNELFHSGKFAEACLAYGEGLKHHPANSVLYCNRAACMFKLGQWEKSIEDCNEALKIQPNYWKALLRRAASYGKMENWADSVKDYEVLRRELPSDTEVAEGHFHAFVALRSSRGEDVSNMKFGGEVEALLGTEQFQMATALPGVSVVHFMAPLNQQCSDIAPFVDALCTRYPSVNFLKVDITENPTVTQLENVKTVPTFKIYKDGTRVMEMICPSHQLLESSLRQFEV